MWRVTDDLSTLKLLLTFGDLALPQINRSVPDTNFIKIININKSTKKNYDSKQKQKLVFISLISYEIPYDLPFFTMRRHT